LRETIILRAIALLKEKGFMVEHFPHSNACFDLAARRADSALVVKVFNNIDALREEHAGELRKIAVLFNAAALIIGEKSKAFGLRDSVLYERHGIMALSLRSFRDLLEQKFPAVRYFKGKEIVELDSQQLRSRRKEMGLTLSELAEKIGSTIESVYRYEKGASTSLATAEKLEDALDTVLVRQINLLQMERGKKGAGEKFYGGPIGDEALEKVRDLGVEMAFFNHAPFRAYSQPSEGLLIGRGKQKACLEAKALELGKARRVLKGKPVIITQETRFSRIAEVPVVSEEELGTLSKFKDLMKLIREREKSG